MNSNLQTQIDKQIELHRGTSVVEVSDAPKLTEDIFSTDMEYVSACVEINFAKGTADVVEASDAPKLTHKVLLTKGKPIKIVEIFFHNRVWQVAVKDGKPYHVEVGQLQRQIIDTKAMENEKVPMPVLEKQAEREIANFLLSKMMVDPAFSFQGIGVGQPIETCSSVLIAALTTAYNKVNDPTQDEIYQVTVRRGIPADAYALFGNGFEWYPTQGDTQKPLQMSEDELIEYEARQHEIRGTLLLSMITEPVLRRGTPFSENAAALRVSETFKDSEDIPASLYPELVDGFPIEELSERYLTGLYEAHRVVNVPEAGLKSLQRFLSTHADTTGTAKSGK